MIIGIDYDDTFTRDPALWCRFIDDARRSGHKVVCVTARREPPDYSREPRLPAFVPIVCAGDQWKKHAAAKAGHYVHVWIDDMPQLIAPPLKLLDDFREPGVTG